jgi:exonuclease III
LQAVLEKYRKILTIEIGIHPITNTMDDKQPQIKCIQVNVQHSKPAIAKLMEITKEDKTDIICIQEPHTFQSKATGILKKYKTFTSGERRRRAVVVATNNQIDTVLIQQLWDADTVVVEIIKNSLKIMVSMYFDTENPIEHDLV